MRTKERKGTAATAPSTTNLTINPKEKETAMSKSTHLAKDNVNNLNRKDQVMNNLMKEKANVKPKHELAFLNKYFEWVSYDTYKVKDGETCSRHRLTEDKPNYFKCRSEDLMTHVLNLEHSFIIKAGPEIKLIRAYIDKDIVRPEDFQAIIGLELSNNDKPSKEKNRFKKMLRERRVEFKYYNYMRLNTEWKMEVGNLSLGSAVNPQFLQGLLFNLYQDMGLIDVNTAYDQETIIDACIQGNDKLGKRMKRLFRPYRYYAFKQTNVFVDTTYAVNHHDGNALILRKYVRKTFGINVQVGQSVELTIQTPEYQLKEHAIVVDSLPKDREVVILGDQTKNEIRTKDHFIGIEPHKPYCSSVYTDMQTVCNQWNFYKDKLEPWAEKMLTDVVENFMTGNFPRPIKEGALDNVNEEGILKDKWALKRAAFHNIPMNFPWLSRRAWNFFRSSIEKLEKSNIRIEMPGFKRGYLTCIYKKNDPNSPKKGSIVINKGRVHVHEADTEWLWPLLGGADGDDGVIMCKLDNGKILLTRNPNMLGEWACMNLDSSDEEFKVSYSSKGLPSININKKAMTAIASNGTEKKVENLQSYIVDNYDIEEWLINRLPKYLRDEVETIQGPLTKTMTAIHDMVIEADVAVKDYIKEDLEIPEDVYKILSEDTNNHMVVIAEGIKNEYAANVGKLMSYLERNKDKWDEKLLKTKTDNGFKKLNGRVRGELAKYTHEEQVNIIKSLARMCYVDGGEITGDGVLGVPSTTKTVGTADVFVDWLVEEGIGTRLGASSSNSKVNELVDMLFAPDGEEEETPVSLRVKLNAGWYGKHKSGKLSIAEIERKQKLYLNNNYKLVKDDTFGGLYLEGTDLYVSKRDLKHVKEGGLVKVDTGFAFSMVGIVL